MADLVKFIYLTVFCKSQRHFINYLKYFLTKELHRHVYIDYKKEIRKKYANFGFKSLPQYAIFSNLYLTKNLIFDYKFYVPNQNSEKII